MRKKKVAVFGNAWGYEYFQLIMSGIRKYANEHTIDVDFFVSYSTERLSDAVKMGEINIFHLPDLKQYDGAIVLANSINVQEENEYIRKALLEAQIPCVCLEYELEGLSFIGSENYSGMYELAEHLFKDHGMRKVLYIGGPKDNVEAQERCKAVLDVSKKYGVLLDKTNCYYGDWSFRCIENIVGNYFDKNGEKPDAIICANDVMAVGVCGELPKYGYTPGVDIAVTGFDGLRQGSLYYPAITSVRRNWNSMGYIAMQQILEDALTMERPKRTVTKSSLSVGESCGCSLCQDELVVRRLNGKSKGEKFSGSVELDIHMRKIYGAMHNCSKIEELHQRLSKLMCEEGKHYESDTFFLCLDPNFFKAEMDNVPLLRQVGYPEQMILATAVYNKEIKPIEIIKTTDLIPSYVRESETANIMVYLPLFLEDRTMGYVAMRTDEMQYEETILYIWAKNMIQYLEQIRQNIQINALTEQLMLLSATDGLTGLYNRRGYTELAQPYFDKKISEGKSMAFIMCDIDDMKEINDNFGHLLGDLAICTLANAIKESIREDWYACRYGGDEFLIIGECDCEDIILEVEKSIEKNVKKQVDISKIPFRIVASIGGVLMHEDDGLSFETAVKMADDRMYKVKKMHKAEYDGEVR